MPCLFLNIERGFGGKPPKKSGFRRHLAGSKMPKEGSKMPKETFFTAISRWRVVSRPTPDGRSAPLGDRAEDRKLVVMDSEAEIVRAIFRRYAELCSAADRSDGIS